MKKLAAFIVPFVLVCAIWSYSDDKSEKRTVYPTDPSTSHTMLFYLGIDNNFSSERYKIETLRRAWNPEYDANLIVYADGGDNTVIVSIHHDMYGEAIADTLKIYDRENSASPEVFARVLEDVYGDFPAETNGLLVLSHASGWLRQGKISWPRSRTVIDDTAEGYQLDLWDFAECIPKKLDYIIFDACLMSGAEVMSELYGKTKYVVASPPEILAEYIEYDKISAYLFKSSGPDLQGVIDCIYEFTEKQSYPHIALALIDVDCIGELEQVCREAFASLGIGSGNGFEDYLDIDALQQFLPRATYTNRTSGITYDVYPFYTDLWDITESLSNDGYLDPGIYGAFTAAIQKCVVHSRYTSSYYSAYTGRAHSIDKFSGLTMYILRDDFPEINEDYKILKWYNAVMQ